MWVGLYFVIFDLNTMTNIYQNKSYFMFDALFKSNNNMFIVDNMIIMDIQVNVSKGCNKLSKYVIISIGDVNVIILNI